jgi:hypothetical protein
MNGELFNLYSARLDDSRVRDTLSCVSDSLWDKD